MGFLHTARLTAQVARTPVHLAQTVENRPANPEFRVRPEQHVFALVVLVQCIDQPDDTGMYQVFERNVAGQAFVNAAGNGADLGQLLGEEPLALFFVLPHAVGSLACPHHGLIKCGEPENAIRARLRSCFSEKSFPVQHAGKKWDLPRSKTSHGFNTDLYGSKCKRSRCWGWNLFGFVLSA